MHMSETTFSHQKANSPDAAYSDGGLRSFFVYRDTGINAATKGKLRVQLVRTAHKSSEAKGGTGFHFHTVDVHVVYMIRGWAKFDYDGVDTLVEAGDCVHQRPGIVHSLYDWSDDMEFMEIIIPGDFATTEITAPADTAMLSSASS
jgi:quercetin dioxygenase-like cupin family protein